MNTQRKGRFCEWTRLAFTTTVILLSVSPLIHAAAGENETGVVQGTVKIFKARHSGDVVVYLEGQALNKPYPPPEKHPLIDQKNLKFVPHVLPVLKGTTVDFHNSDDVQHNVFSPGKAEKFNLGTWGRGEVRDYTFSKAGEVVLLCNVHSEMISYIIVLENPYFAVTDEKGNFKIENIPSGTCLLRTWHEKMKSDPQEVIIAKGEIKEIHLELKKRK